MKFIENSSALIVGGTSGMGLATAKILAENGVKPIVVGRNEEKINAVKNQIDSVEAIKAELYQPEGVMEVVNRIESDENLRYLVNAAGYFSPKPFLEHTIEDYDIYMGLNKATFVITQAASKRIIENGGRQYSQHRFDVG